MNFVDSNVMFENAYTNNIEVLYGFKRDPLEDVILMETNIVPHDYSVNVRVNCCAQQAYSIDPDGCQDADDAFSIYHENGNLILDIHIADPTEYIDPNSVLWKDIVDRTVTRYISNRDPIHMLPFEIMEKSSLMKNEYGDIKNAITIRTFIDEDSYKPIGDVSILFSRIRVDKRTAFTYKQASELKYVDPMINRGVKISKALLEIRSNNTLGTKLTEVSRSYVKYSESGPYLYKDSPEEIEMKQMIGEFAIFANSFVGEYLKLHFKGMGIFRTCHASDWLNTLDSNISGTELLNRIIKDGISADYLAENASHDLVGMPSYCHFTSPMRRLSDCLCHYILKYIHFEKYYKQHERRHIPNIFTNQELESMSKRCYDVTKYMKNVQYKDTKFRLIQTMKNILNDTSKPIKLQFFFTSYMKSFINIIINKINEHDVYMSYTLRKPDFHCPDSSCEYKINITYVDIPGKYDQGSIPELDRIVLNDTYHAYEISNQTSESSITSYEGSSSGV